MQDRIFPNIPTQAEIEANQQAAKLQYELHARTLATLDGGPSLIALFGYAPSFHDGEITDLNLRRKGMSKIRIRLPYPDIFARGSVFVTFEIEQLLDIQLEGFSPQNVIFGLSITPYPRNAEREAHYGYEVGATDLKLEFEPTWGVGGELIARGVKVAWTMDHIARKLPRPAPPGELLGQ